MKKIILGLLISISIGTVSILSYKGDVAFKADCCNDGSKCCTQSCCEDHK